MAAQNMSTQRTKTLEELLKEYDSTPIEYDPKVDEDEEHLVRDDLLKEKERMKDIITKLKEKNRGDRKIRR
ncbi:MAG: hypothetical protein Q8M39_03980 [Sulfuricurvum sp.]|nr:hypothetical protein [Sulfuricurvum sp.]